MRVARFREQPLRRLPFGFGGRRRRAGLVELLAGFAQFPFPLLDLLPQFLLQPVVRRPPCRRP